MADRYVLEDAVGIDDTKDLLVDGEAIAEIAILPGDSDLFKAQLTDLIAQANRALQRNSKPQATPSPAPTSLPTGLVNDVDDLSAAGFLVQHCVPFIGPEIGSELLKIVKRIDIVAKVYPLPPTVEAYRLALHLMLQIAAKHQDAFCTMMERIVNDESCKI